MDKERQMHSNVNMVEGHIWTTEHGQRKADFLKIFITPGHYSVDLMNI